MSEIIDKSRESAGNKVGPGNPPVEHQFQPGQSGNPAGRPKGQRNLATIIRDLLEQDINWDLVPVKNAQELAERYKGKTGWDALVYTAVAQAVSGNTKAMAWLSKSGYGDKVMHEIDPGFLNVEKMEITVVKAKAEPEREAEPGAGAPEQPTNN